MVAPGVCSTTGSPRAGLVRPHIAQAQREREIERAWDEEDAIDARRYDHTKKQPLGVDYLANYSAHLWNDEKRLEKLYMHPLFGALCSALESLAGTIHNATDTALPKPNSIYGVETARSRDQKTSDCASVSCDFTRLFS